jgi:phosphate transport system substrate-binding protein
MRTVLFCSGLCLKVNLFQKYTPTLLLCALGLGLGLIPGALPAQTAAAKPAAAKPAAKKAVAAKPKAPPPAPTIIWRGDRATERAFVGDLVKQYELSKLGKVTMQPFSTVSGIDAVHDGTADIAGSARPAMPDRAEEAGLTFYPIAWEALVPITSPKNPVDDISLKQLYELYLGHITSWKDLGGADEPINLYGIAAPLDGVEYSLRQLLYHKGNQTVAIPRLYLNSAKLEDGVTIDPHSLGLTTFSAVYANKAIKILKVEGTGASTASIADGSYPLYVPLYLAARDESKNKEAVEKFIKYASSDAGKAVIRKHALVPYEDAPSLVAKEPERVAFVDARIAAATTSTPVSAPIASADYLLRTQPNSAKAQEAKQRAAQAQAQMRDAKDKGQ